MTEVRLSAVGHPAVTGRHDKTLELTAEDAITARATCVLGVAAGPLPGRLPTLRGPVRLTLAAGGATAAVHGEVNPGYASADRLVVRRSDQLDPDTFLVNASGAAADLPPGLLAALRSPGSPVEVTVAEVGTPPPVLLVLLPGEAPAGIARLAAQADLVVDLTGRGAPAPAVALGAPRRHGVPGDLAGRRTVAVLAESVDLVPPVVAALPGARVLLWPPAPGVDLLLAAGLPPTPALLAGALPDTATGRRDLGRRVAATGVPALLTVPAGHRPPADPSGAAGPGAGVGEVWAELPGWRLVVPAPAVGWGVGATVAAAGEPVDLTGVRRAPVVAFVPPPGQERLSVAPGQLARWLRDAGASGRDTAAVLTGLGVPRREAYRLAAEQG